MAWFKKTRKPIASSTAEKPSRVPEGLWIKCPGCTQLIYKKDLEESLNVCPKCTHHFRIGAAERLRALFDGGHYTEHFPNLISTDPLRFTDTKPYRLRLKTTISSTGLKDAIIVATGKLDGDGAGTSAVIDLTAFRSHADPHAVCVSILQGP